MSRCGEDSRDCSIAPRRRFSSHIILDFSQELTPANDP